MTIRSMRASACGSETITRLRARAPLSAAQKGRPDNLTRGVVEMVTLHDDRRVLCPPSSSCTLASRHATVSQTWVPRFPGQSREADAVHAGVHGRFPYTEPAPVTRLTTPGGTPARSSSCIRKTADHGVSDAGLKTTQFPRRAQAQSCGRA